ncbi:hypothetical protein FACS1894184_05120 [Clostridia bacterium]|nr:hypothetical protein FACS1894184_05120 [Clostridia bacterium]
MPFALQVNTDVLKEGAARANKVAQSMNDAQRRLGQIASALPYLGGLNVNLDQRLNFASIHGGSVAAAIRNTGLASHQVGDTTKQFETGIQQVCGIFLRNEDDITNSNLDDFDDTADKDGSTPAGDDNTIYGSEVSDTKVGKLPSESLTYKKYKELLGAGDDYINAFLKIMGLEGKRLKTMAEIGKYLNENMGIITKNKAVAELFEAVKFDGAFFKMLDKVGLGKNFLELFLMRMDVELMRASMGDNLSAEAAQSIKYTQDTVDLTYGLYIAECVIKGGITVAMGPHVTAFVSLLQSLTGGSPAKKILNDTKIDFDKMTHFYDQYLVE